MADKITQKNVIQITTRDTEGSRFSFNLENPKTNITIAQVRTIFEPLINSGKWYSKTGNQINYIEQATVTKTKKIELGEGTGAITITPTQGGYSGTGKKSIIFTIDGAPITGYKIEATEAVANMEIEARINTVENTITFDLNSSYQRNGQFDITVVTTSGPIEGKIIVT